MYKIELDLWKRIAIVVLEMFKKISFLISYHKLYKTWYTYDVFWHIKVYYASEDEQNPL